MSTTTNLSTLVINYLTQAQYDTALANNQIDADQLYLTPSSTPNIEINSSGNWTWVTIGSLFIGWCRHTGSLAIQTQVGQLYQSASSSVINDYPVTLSAIKHADITIANNSYSVWGVLYNATTTALYYRALSTASRATASYTIMATVVGTIA